MILRVAIDVPRSAHRAASADDARDDLFDYRWCDLARIGQRVIVPWGKQTVIGLVVDTASDSTLEAGRVKDAVAVLDDVAPLGADWLELIRFAARYYQRGLGEVALPALPTLLRQAQGYRQDSEPADPANAGWSSRSLRMLRKKLARMADQSGGTSAGGASASGTSADAALAGQDALSVATARAPALNAEQAHALAQITESKGFTPILLHGITGSGKTEVYLHAVGRVLQQGGQALVLVPEINLTPQLEQVFRNRFPGAHLASLHSGLADGERAVQWLAAHEGHADIVLGTRMAVLASLPRLALIVVDEEHDPSFKQQEGLRYSARDLAVVRARQRAIPVLLGSATPSLESWVQAQRGRYRKLQLSSRAVGDAQLPQIRLIGLARTPLAHGFSATLREAIGQRLARSEQVLIFHNRRGYAPVLTCNACGWISDCQRCSVHTVFHKSDGRLHCHHCGWAVRVPRACPDCGNVDLSPLGRGTQRVEEALMEWFPQARIARIDRDSTRRKGAARQLFDAVHAGTIDLMVGTQMVAKGHDFRNLTLVGVLDADAALFSHDFRAPERLFASLMQVSGRAGRADKPGEVMIQTRYPQHPLFEALVAHDFARFAESQLVERRNAGLPPFTHQAMLRAEARSQEGALGFLAEARSLAEALAAGAVNLYDPVPMGLHRLVNVERAQLLFESPSRTALQAFLPRLIDALGAVKTRARWHIEVDPLEI